MRSGLLDAAAPRYHPLRQAIGHTRHRRDLPYTYLEPVPDFWQAMASMILWLRTASKPFPPRGRRDLVDIGSK